MIYKSKEVSDKFITNQMFENLYSYKISYKKHHTKFCGKFRQ